MRTTFYEIIPETLRREKGLALNPNDRGGATNWGVTIGALRRHDIDVDGDGDIDVDDIKVMPMDLAIDIYKKYYWDPARVDQMPDRLKDLYFDMCVNHGQENAVDVIQQAVNHKGPDITVDGLIGPQTLSHARLLTVKDVVYQRLYFDSEICFNDVSQLEFRNGWYNRVIGFLSVN